MEIRADEISRILREQIKSYGKQIEVNETGTVLSTGDGIARVYGLAGVMAGELVEFAGGLRGLVLNLEEDNVGVAIMGEFRDVREGDVVKRTGRIAEVPVGMEMVGRVVNALGQPVDGKGPLGGKDRRKIEVKAPGIVARAAARHIPATCSTCTRACSSAPPSSTRPRAAARSPHCPSSKPRRATSRPISPPT